MKKENNVKLKTNLCEMPMDTGEEYWPYALSLMTYRSFLKQELKLSLLKWWILKLPFHV